MNRRHVLSAAGLVAIGFASRAVIVASPETIATADRPRLHPARYVPGEDRIVIEQIGSSPERRVFWVDVGDLPPDRVETAMHEVLARYRPLSAAG